MKEEKELMVALAQKQTLLKTAGWNRRISRVERDHVWMGAVKKDVLLILYVISIA